MKIVSQRPKSAKAKRVRVEICRLPVELPRELRPLPKEEEVEATLGREAVEPIAGVRHLIEVHEWRKGAPRPVTGRGALAARETCIAVFVDGRTAPLSGERLYLVEHGGNPFRPTVFIAVEREHLWSEESESTNTLVYVRREPAS